MDVKLPTINPDATSVNYDEVTGYYLVSKRWTMINDVNITFIRCKGLGYCYNSKWAGPMSKFEAEKICQSKKTTLIISHSLLKSFLVITSDSVSLPNTGEIRKLIGLDSGELQLAN
ncbi:hypothetical protein HNP99_002358 [Flavobacterium sp. 28A]|uniref:hypothetical protein n=1 Tax=Flavobacterium sp. 28A TaxID=2735895 RepID=UPI00156F76AA|nr:hypothetical protein [Flavobacterium sp. 28A]NRT15996.1 hypothetical protein [Flavobacterium sp. 28A]